MRKNFLLLIMTIFILDFFSSAFASSFDAPRVFFAGNTPKSAAIGDFNNDGIPDLAVANNYSNNVSILIGKGGGTFEAAVNYNTGFGSASVITGDFNLDGNVDLAVANSGSYIDTGQEKEEDDTVSILLGNGDGTFQAAVNYSAGGDVPNSITSADFNGDGKSDLVIANMGTSNVSVFLGNGDGTFGSAASYGVGLAPGSVAVGDFNEDGKSDLAVTNYWRNNVSILLGDGDGTFLPAVDYNSGENPSSVVVGDFNRDGNADLAVASNEYGGGVWIFLGNGDGTFQDAVTYDPFNDLVSLSTGDFNKDGITDIAAVNTYEGAVSIMISNGDGTFKDAMRYSTGNSPVAVVTGDIDGDGKTDLVISNSGIFNPDVVRNDRANVLIMMGRGDGTFKTAASYGEGSFESSSVSAGDFNGDGISDLVVTDDKRITPYTVFFFIGRGDGTFGTEIGIGEINLARFTTIGDFNGDEVPDIVVTSNRGVSILLCNGDGTFMPAVELTYDYRKIPFEAEIGDFNRDGKTDLAVSYYEINSVSILLGNGDGTFQDEMFYGTGLRPLSVKSGDFNNDGVLDLAVSNHGDSSISILLGNGDGTFQPAVNHDAGSSPFSIVVRDFNKDGNADIAVANKDSYSVSVLLGNGDGTLQGAVPYETGFGPSSVTTGDYNEDGIYDLAVANTYDGTVLILEGNGDGTFIPAATYGTLGWRISVATSDFNGDGRDDLALTIHNYNFNSVSVLINTTRKYTLTVSKTGTGSGIITSNPPGINCGTSCSYGFNYVTLKATPDTGSRFVKWSGDCSSCGTNTECNITMSEDKSCSAIFIPSDYYLLTVTKTGTGDGMVTSAPVRINCGADCDETYPKAPRAKNVTLKVRPDVYSTFLGWGGDCQARGTKQTCTIKMDFDKDVTASFGLPDISVSPNSYDFGNIGVKQLLSPVTFTIQNNGTGNLKITKMQIVGTDAKMFKIKGGGKKTILPGGIYQFVVTFKPRSSGYKSATLRVMSNDPDNPMINIQLSGTGNM